MDELQLVRTALPRPSGPQDAVVTAGRLALLAEAATEIERAQPVPHALAAAAGRRRRRLLASGALALGLLSVLTVAQNVGVGSNHSLLPGAAVASAADLGDRAAAAAEVTPYRHPGPKQWVYVRFETSAQFDLNQWWKGGTGRTTVERWQRVDGTADAIVDANGQPEIRRLSVPGSPWRRGTGPPRVGVLSGRRAGSGGPNVGLATYPSLPTDPLALLARLRTPYRDQVGPTTDADVFGIISTMLADPLPPRLRASLYRIVPTLAGVGVDRDAVDATGRHGVAFTLDDDPYRNVIILDPRTYRYLGNYVFAIRDYQISGGGLLKKGTYLTSIAQLAQGIVDRPRQRP
jgi:hypothetical protein